MKETIRSLKEALQNEKKARLAAEKKLAQETAILNTVKKELKEKTTEFEGVFGNLIDSFILMDTMGNVFKMNDAAKNFFGYDIEKEDFNVVSIIYEEDYKYAMASFAKLIEEGSFSNYEARIYTKSRDIKWVQINSSLVYDQNGIPIAAQGIVRDITEAKKNTEVFESQKEQLAAIVDNSSLGIVLAENRKILKTNVAFEELVQYSADELTQMRIEDISYIEEGDEAGKLLDKMIVGELNNYVVRKRYRRRDGTLFLSRTSVNAVRDSSGAVKYQLGLIEDITEKHKRQVILNTLNNLTRSFIGKLTIQEIAWEIANVTAHDLEFEDCVVYQINKKKNQLEQIASYGAKVNEQKEIINKISVPIGKGIVGTVAQTGKPELINDTSKDKRYIIDDARRFSEITVPIIVNGEVVGIIDSEHPQKNFFTKEHLNLLKNVAHLASVQLTNATNLEKRIEAESQNKELLKDLKRSNKELRDFAHIVSHDLKSPLRSINALISWFQEDYAEVLDEDAAETFVKLNNKLEQMDSLIDGILRYSSVSDKNIIVVQNVVVKNVLEDIKNILYIPPHISLVFPDNLPEINADKTRIKQLFQNLISNAIGHIDKEVGIVEVKFEELKRHWKFSVSDNGVGISKAYHEKIFKIFQTLGQKGKSTGIGLSIVKKIIELYKGEIYLESEVGKGTTFFFTLKK